MRLNQPVTLIEHPVPEGEVLVSKTDLKGEITYCNRAFIDISGYSERELLGAPHNLVRHPDVPSEVFADLWNTVRAGEPWNGIIKNRSKDGGYYWVEANVTPLLENGTAVGYVSLRYKASVQQIALAEQTYRALRDGQFSGRLSGRPDPRYIVALQQRLADKVVALERYRERNEEDRRLASHIMAQMLRIGDDLGGRVRRYARLAEHLSGDVLVAARTPGNLVHVMLADAVGRGLAAAVNVLPVCRAFYELTEKGFSIEQIATDLNELVKRIMPVDRFIATALVAIDYDARVVEVWNGGVPALRLLGRDGRLLQHWPSRHLPLGVLDGSVFYAKPELFHYQEDCQLYLYSDGLIEVCRSEDGIGSDRRVAQVLEAAPYERRFESLIEEFERCLGGQEARDDAVMAMMDVVVEPLRSAGVVATKNAARAEGGDWHVSLKLGAGELRYLDVVPLLSDLLTKMRTVRDHHSALFLILSELFNNALDHGVLRMDSRIKAGLEGFERYLMLRERRLSELSEGEISIEVESVSIDGLPGVKMRIVDSGDGFDYRALQCADRAAQHGRGIALTRSLAHSLIYSGKGNEVEVWYVCA